jgi:cell division protein FtsW (lipid II flippase)
MNDSISVSTTAEKDMVRKSNKATLFLFLAILFVCCAISAPYKWNVRWVYVTCLVLSIVVLPVYMHYFAKYLLQGCQSWEQMKKMQSVEQGRRLGIPPVTPVE